MDFDLVNEPSTAEVMMGARSRGRADPRAVAIEADEFDFDPNPLPSVSSATRAPNTVTAASTGIDVVDPEELKRRIRGDGTPAQLREGALRTLEMITKLARDRREGLWRQRWAQRAPLCGFNPKGNREGSMLTNT
ncbi:unnamed protein product [Effrenium voratum]|uniref:Uncharacterized protein n=1 Tax=Effrenium voratum TaxID=2562239 RepID=A0AA36I5E9_9DINO|nr:unnamed protein product [Effrenium voratum]